MRDSHNRIDSESRPEGSSMGHTRGVSSLFFIFIFSFSPSSQPILITFQRYLDLLSLTLWPYFWSEYRFSAHVRLYSNFPRATSVFDFAWISCWASRRILSLHDPNVIHSETRTTLVMFWHYHYLDDNASPPHVFWKVRCFILKFLSRIVKWYSVSWRQRTDLLAHQSFVRTVYFRCLYNFWYASGWRRCWRFASCPNLIWHPIVAFQAPNPPLPHWAHV